MPSLHPFTFLMFLSLVTSKMLNHRGASLSEYSKLYLECPHRYYSTVRPLWLQRWTKLQSNHELSGESMLCMTGHARRVPEARVHPAVRLSQRPLSRDLQTRTVVQKVSCHEYCHCIQLKSSSLSLSFTPTLQSGSSPSRSLTLGTHAQRGLQYLVCVSVNSTSHFSLVYSCHKRY